MTKLTDELSIEKIISELTLEEKVNFLMAQTTSGSYAIPERNIPELILADGATGANGIHIVLDFLTKRSKALNLENPMSLMGTLLELIELDAQEIAVRFKDDPIKSAFGEFLKERRNPDGVFVSFPSGINIGACFNEDTACRIGELAGEEMRADHISVCLGPNVDMIRDPLGGRNYEMYGEDPVLVERTAAAFIRGMQMTGTMACAKHFIANNQETNRQKKNTHMSVRTLKELYARGFKAAVKDGGVKSVMSAYNAVNGTFSSYNKMLLTDWLKADWGLDGFVVSDWGAVTGNNDQAVAAGMDMILHGFWAGDMGAVVEAVKNGTLDEHRIDDAVGRILKAILWQRSAYEKYTKAYDQSEILQGVLEAVIDGIVLLKNENILPLKPGTRAVILGGSAKETMECGSGSTYVTTSLHSNLYDECRKLGMDVSDNENADAEVLIYSAKAEGGENADRPSMSLDNEDETQIVDTLRRAKNSGKKTVVVLNIAAPVDMRSWIDDADVIVCIFVPGCMGGRGIAEVLLGNASPGGRLPVTFPEKLVDSPAAPYSTGEYSNIYYSEGIFTGYRWYDCKELPVQFPFGYGLSYTSFSYSNVVVSKRWDLKSDETWEVSICVKNTGQKDGAEVIQLYMGRESNKICMPKKELMAYSKVYLRPGEEKTVLLTVKKDSLVVYDVDQAREVIEVGQYDVWLGTSARDMFYEGVAEVIGDNPYPTGSNSTLAEILNNAEAMKILSEYIPQMRSMPEESIRMVKNEKLGTLLERILIGVMPNANELKVFLDALYCRLSKV